MTATNAEVRRFYKKISRELTQAIQVYSDRPGKVLGRFLMPQGMF